MRALSKTVNYIFLAEQGSKFEVRGEKEFIPPPLSIQDKRHKNVIAIQNTLRLFSAECNIYFQSQKASLSIPTYKELNLSLNNVFIKILYMLILSSFKTYVSVLFPIPATYA